jgi:hypothetical protein
VYPTRQWQHTGQDGTSCGHTNHIGRDAIGEPRALPSQQIKMRCLYPAAFESEAISAVLIAHDQQNVRFFQIVSPMFAD